MTQYGIDTARFGGKMELENLFCDNELMELTPPNIPLACSLPSDSEVKSRYGANYLMPCTAGDRDSWYSDNPLQTSNYITSSTSSRSVTSSHDGQSLMSLVSGKSISPSFSGDSVTSSLFSGESVTSSCLDECVTSCELMVSPSSSVSEDLLSHTEFNEIFSYVNPSDESFSDVISCDDVFDPPTKSKMDSFPDNARRDTYTVRNVCQNTVRPTQRIPKEQNVRTYTPRNTPKSNSVSTKPRRKRTQTSRQRSAANVRERNRMVYLNKAFSVLKNKLPGLNNKKLSRIETLRTAISYIRCMKKITS